VKKKKLICFGQFGEMDRGWLNFLEPNYCKVLLDCSFRGRPGPTGRAPTQHDAAPCCVLDIIVAHATSHSSLRVTLSLTTTIGHRAAQQPLILCSDIELIKCIAVFPSVAFRSS